MTSELFQQILKENEDICLHSESLERKWVMQQYNDLHTSISALRLKKNESSVAKSES